MNIGEPKYTKEILIHIKVETDNDKIVVGGFKILLTSMDRSFRQKINTETSDLNNTLDQVDFRMCIEDSFQK